MTPDEKMGKVETDIDCLTKLVSSGQIGRILLATQIADQERIAAVVRREDGMAADVDHLVFEGSSTGLRFGAAGDGCIAPVLKKPLTRSQAFVKSTIDRVCAFVILVLVAPLLLSIALLLKLTSPSPILFRQQGFGLNSEKDEVLKFRTLFDLCADLNAWPSIRQYDKSVTPIGKILRALSLDELVKGWRGGMEIAEDLEKRRAYDLTYVDSYSACWTRRSQLRRFSSS